LHTWNGCTPQKTRDAKRKLARMSLVRILHEPRHIFVTKKRILILGGSFGGVYVAVHLGKMLSQRELEETEIALVNRENYIVFQPLLPEVISGSVKLNHLIAPIRRMAPRANLYTRDIESIDPVARTVTRSPGVRPTPLILSYDHLVIAMRTQLDHSKIPGMREHASPFKYLGDALYLRNQLVRMLEGAEAESDPESRKRLLTFVVAATAPLDTVAVSREAFQELLMHLPGLNSTMQELMSGRMKPGEDLDSIMRKAALVREDLSPSDSAR
jgi:Pyridine nucleotide-disulphide oxidoreductase